MAKCLLFSLHFLEFLFGIIHSGKNLRLGVCGSFAELYLVGFAYMVYIRLNIKHIKYNRIEFTGHGKIPFSSPFQGLVMHIACTYPIEQCFIVPSTSSPQPKLCLYHAGHMSRSPLLFPLFAIATSPSSLLPYISHRPLNLFIPQSTSPHSSQSTHPAVPQAETAPPASPRLLSSSPTTH
jgi:hypothetical protein